MKNLKKFTYDSKTGLILMNGKKCGHFHNGYIRICNILAHRLAWFLYYGKWPEFQIDHINGNKSDNRIKNLRDVSLRKNQTNKISHRNGAKVGANFHKTRKTWHSQIRTKNGRINLGTFKNEIDAHKAYMKAFNKINSQKNKKLEAAVESI